MLLCTATLHARGGARLIFSSKRTWQLVVNTAKGDFWHVVYAGLCSTCVFAVTLMQTGFIPSKNGEGTGNSCKSQHSFQVFGQLQMIYVDLSETQRLKSKPAFRKARKTNDSYISSPAEAGIHWDRK